jgi:glycine hydroxymethyltransferase
MLLLDLRDHGCSGAAIERRLEALGVLANRNLVPEDPRSPSETSGLRIGATNLAILGYEQADLELLGDWLVHALRDEAPPTTVVEHLVDKYQRHLMTPLW